MTTNRKEWMKKYVEKNREKINAYNKAWMRESRGGLKPKKPIVEHKDFWVKKGHCKSCGILSGKEFCNDCLENPEGVLMGRKLAELV